MSISLPERLTIQFYDWERLGRGWYKCDVPVELEPPFTPFFFHAPAPFKNGVDDGRRHSFLSIIIESFKSRPIDEDRVEEQLIVQPFVFNNTEELQFISITLPKERKVDPVRSEELLLMLSYSSSPISFEIIATSEKILIQFACRTSSTRQLVSQVKAYFPEVIVQESSDSLIDLIQDDYFAAIYDFGLKSEFMRPVVMTDTFNPDPLIGLYGILDTLQDEEHAVIQVLFTGTQNPWSESIMRSVMDNEGGSFFLDAPEMLPLAKEKIASPLFAVSIHVLGGGKSIKEAHQVAGRVGSALVRFYTSPYNSIIPLNDDTYDFDSRMYDVLSRTSHRIGMLLNSKELVTILHFPDSSVFSSKLVPSGRKTKTSPKITEGYSFVLGINEHQGKVKPVTVSSDQRLKHTHITGATGTGKSTFLLNLITEDIKQGNGIAVLDPHGDLIESIISYIPEERAEDILIIDPADSEYPIGFNILEAHSEIEKEILSSDLVAGFRRLSTSWGDQMNSVFANAILAFLESEQGGTLADVRRFLVEKSFRDSFLKTVSDPNVIYYWQKEYPLLRSNSIGSILTRLDTFLRPKLIRNMVSQRKGLDFDHLLDTKKIILIKLSQGLIGAENSYLLGTVVVSKIHQAAMARQAKAKADRSDFFLYIDEFQNFITPSMSSILSGARKYHLGLILAHQDMQQLVKVDSELASSVLSNAGTRICFRVGDADAKRFAEGFSSFEQEDLQNLNTGEAIARIDRPEFDFSLTVQSLPAATMSVELQNHIISRSREKYGTPREEIENLLKVSREDDISEQVVLQEIKPIIQPTKQVQPLKSEPKKENEIKEIQTETVTSLNKQKEQSQHRYLQSLIKRMAESRGYRTTIEEPTPDGKGRVDVSLFRNTQKIAVEISVTTETDWEIHNIEKCLAAGYDIVVACSNEKKTLENIRSKIEDSFDETMKSKILIFEPEQFFMYLDKEVAKEASTEKRMKGYRVKVNYDALPDDIAAQKKEHILKAVGKSMRKDKPKK